MVLHKVNTLHFSNYFLLCIKFSPCISVQVTNETSYSQSVLTVMKLSLSWHIQYGTSVKNGLNACENFRSLMIILML